MVAERYGQLLDVIPDTRKAFVPCLIKLLQDEEAEVRTAAAFQVASTCESNPDLAVVASVLDCVKQLVEDLNQHVRAALAERSAVETGKSSWMKATRSETNKPRS